MATFVYIPTHPLPTGSELSKRPGRAALSQSCGYDMCMYIHIYIYIQIDMFKYVHVDADVCAYVYTCLQIVR